jgi:hypothetical protein
VPTWIPYAQSRRRLASSQFARNTREKTAASTITCFHPHHDRCIPHSALTLDQEAYSKSIVPTWLTAPRSKRLRLPSRLLIETASMIIEVILMHVLLEAVPI